MLHGDNDSGGECGHAPAGYAPTNNPLLPRLPTASGWRPFQPVLRASSFVQPPLPTPKMDTTATGTTPAAQGLDLAQFGQWLVEPFFNWGHTPETETTGVSLGTSACFYHLAAGFGAN